MKKNLLSLLLALTSFFSNAQTKSMKIGTFPLAVPEENSLLAKWEKKPVLDSLVISDMETDGKWRVTGIGEMSFTKDRAKDGNRSLRFRSAVRDAAYLALPGNFTATGSQYFQINGQAGASTVELDFEKPRDWSAYNRVSFWVYLHPTSLPRQNITMSIINEGTVPGPLTTARSHYINDLKPGMWNHVLFEMPHLPRNKVTAFTIKRQLTGFNDGEDSIATYDIDRLQIQRVVTDQFEGWTVSPEKFSFSHIGYRPLDSKIALVGKGAGSSFQLINQKNVVVFTGNLRKIQNKNGDFNQLDFSKWKAAGVYRIRTGSLLSNQFPINDNVWLQPVIKAVNFYFCERCGYEVPGIHKECHKDWQGVRGNVTKVINGGYHDAGDLSQGIWRTSMATFAMMQNFEVLEKRQDGVEVSAKILEEIKWGLKYVLNTRFGDGFHIHWCRMRMFTDNIIGNEDDVVVAAQNVPWENFLAAAVEAKAAKLLAKTDPGLSRELRNAAIEDWQAGFDSTSSKINVSLEEASWGVTSSLLMASLTGDEKYKTQAAVFGNQVVQCQEQRFVHGIPITGYFYSNTNRRQVIHNKHSAFEEAPMIALAMLCKELPQNNDWVNWYSSAVLYSEFFLKRGSQISAPFNMLPNSVWSKTELLADKDETRRVTNLRQFNDGTRLNDEYVLRTFPIWSDAIFHGNTNVQLSGAWALAEASRMRNDTEGMKLVARQLEWVLGANPFGQSMMYGAGYDFAPQFVYCLRGIVGGIPVGMDSRAGDMPYWPATNTATYKEIWMEPVSRFMGAVSVYSSRDQKFIPKQEAAKNIEIQTNAAQSGGGLVSVTIMVTGKGKHEIDIRLFNAKGNILKKEINLTDKASEKILLQMEVIDQEKPYVAVITADKNPDLRKEVVGSYNTNSSILALK